MHIVHALFSPHMGGLEASYVDTTDVLIANGHKISVLCHENSPYRESLSQLGCAIYTAVPTGFYDIFAAWKVRRLLHKIKPDLIIAHNARAISLLSFAALGTGILVCGVSHSYKTPRTMRADRLVVLTEHMRAHFIKAGFSPEKLHVIPNLIRLTAVPVVKPRHTPVTIGAIGRFRTDKGFDAFLRALHLLKQKNIYFSAYIGGRGEESGALHLLAEKYGLASHIKWEGWVQDKEAFYQQLDIMCLPSLEESFGIVVLEALAHGIPIVASNVSGPASIITNGKNGLLAQPGNGKDIANAIEYLIDNPDLAERIIQEGWKRAQDFSFSTIADKWEEALRDFFSSLSGRGLG